MKFGIVTFPGSNGDYDAFHAAADSIGETAVYLWHKDHDLQGCDVIVLPGGFSYGDYLRAGAIARFSPIMTEVIAHVRRGAPVLAICNGFQVACEAGLLPGALLRNLSLRFVSRAVDIRVENADSMFTREYYSGQILSVPVAHGEGRYVADSGVIAALESDGRVAFRYCAPDGGRADADNINGSVNGIAGILNERGNVLGLMPHPERAVDPMLGPPDGLGVFHSLLARVAS
ncbi:MAG: phosphoribosylformylglycinamidine synthase subunit PurQ [Gemmatimonadota bacterium]|nr:phosphoribosylformylglycinamidine synthase subunit PurQ [Gemmatimonadota bacterium]